MTHCNQNDKNYILKAAREKQQITHKGTPIRLSADFLTEILESSQSGTIFEVMKGEKLRTKNTLPSNVLFQN